MIKKVIALVLLICIPSISFAKYCPSCLKTFQVQTTRGQAQLLYQWMMKTLDPQKPLNEQDIDHLFSKSVVIYNNGHRVVESRDEVYQWLKKLRLEQPLQQSKMQQLLVDQNFAVISFQKITGSNSSKQRRLVIAILEFQGHKLIEWRSVTHTTKIG